MIPFACLNINLFIFNRILVRWTAMSAVERGTKKLAHMKWWLLLEFRIFVFISHPSFFLYETKIKHTMKSLNYLRQNKHEKYSTTISCIFRGFKTTPLSAPMTQFSLSIFMGRRTFLGVIVKLLSDNANTRLLVVGIIDNNQFTIPSQQWRDEERQQD